MKSKVCLKHISKKYTFGEVQVDALKDINFSIEHGEFVIILGASGSGKSTILNLLGGMDTASGGDILVAGNLITKYNENDLSRYRRDEIGFVFQSYNLISNLTALENVEFGASLHKNHLDPNDVLERVGLGARKNSFPTQLSGGEQQRVAIARAVAKNPFMLLCDEPTGALDYKTGKEVLSLLEKINHDYEKTVIMVTHNSLVAPMADKVITVKSGNIEDITVNQNKTSVRGLKW